MSQQDTGRSTGKLSYDSYFDLFHLAASDQILPNLTTSNVTDPPGACQRCSGLTFGEYLTMTEAGNGNSIFQRFAITFTAMLVGWSDSPMLPFFIQATYRCPGHQTTWPS